MHSIIRFNLKRVWKRKKVKLTNELYLIQYIMNYPLNIIAQIYLHIENQNGHKYNKEAP